MEGLRIMFVAGEASGDMHGANLAEAVLEIDPKARMFGMGGTLMKKAGVKLLFNPTSISIIGFVEALKSASVFRRVLLRMGEVMDRQNPDVVVLIDFPGFNMRLAEIAHRKGIPVLYYFSPSAWAWGKGRAEKLAKTVTKIASVFPFEAEVYEEAGADVDFVGHPLLDIVKPTMTREQAIEEFGLNPSQSIVSLLPGSREGEIRNLFPVMLKTAAQVKEAVPEAQFIMPVAHTIKRELVESLVEKHLPSVNLIEGKAYDVLNVSDCAVIGCGTATLEAAIIGTPHVAVYKTSASTYMISKMLVKIPYIALPNIIAGKEVVPELLQHEATPSKISKALLPMLTDTESPTAVETIRSEFKDVVAKLGEPGAVKRVANLVLDIGDKHRRGEME